MTDPRNAAIRKLQELMHELFTMAQENLEKPEAVCYGQALIHLENAILRLMEAKRMAVGNDIQYR